MAEDRPGLPIDPDLAPADPGQPTLPGRSHLSYHSNLPYRRRSRASPDVLAVIALGGMLGATARYGLARLLPTGTGQFPWATFLTNLSGSFLLGLLLSLLFERAPRARLLRPFAATGILGAFTTMSTYQVETVLLFRDGHPLTAGSYGAGSLLAGLALAYLGILAGRHAKSRHRNGSR